MEIYQAGGGIHFTVEHTRRATEDQLYHLLRDRLMRMLYNGLSTLHNPTSFFPFSFFFSLWVIIPNWFIDCFFSDLLGSIQVDH